MYKGVVHRYTYGYSNSQLICCLSSAAQEGIRQLQGSAAAGQRKEAESKGGHAAGKTENSPFDRWSFNCIRFVCLLVSKCIVFTHSMNQSS